jgi:hypothetical protein
MSMLNLIKVVMNHLKKVVGVGLFGGTTLWVWSNNREKTVTFYSPEEFEKFTSGLHSFNVDEAMSGQPQWLSRLKYNWLSDVPLIIESISQHHRKEVVYSFTMEDGLFWKTFTIDNKEGPVIIDQHRRTIYKCMTRISKKELSLGKLDPESGLVKWSRDYHDSESFSEFMKAYEAEPETRWRANAATWYPIMTTRIKQVCKDDRHIKIKMVYRERLSPLYLLRLCGFE